MAHRFEQQIEEKHRADDAEDSTHRHFVGIADEAGDDVGFGGTEFKDKEWFHTAFFI